VVVYVLRQAAAVLRQAAAVLGVSQHTVRRWVEAGRVQPAAGEGPLAIDGVELGGLAQELAVATVRPTGAPSGTAVPMNRFVGLGTAVAGDGLLGRGDPGRSAPVGIGDVAARRGGGRHRSRGPGRHVGRVRRRSCRVR
jgi:hypothetical protein